MCDTIGIIDKKNKCSWFAKNSDRSPNECQCIEFIPHQRHNNKKLKVTYTEIEQVKETNAILISRPNWLWGAEMGVNEYGVCIGNEAIFTKGKYLKTGLIGMDLVRLGLERSKNAKEALDVIIKLLDKYNQGGNCGYDHSFYYDNSFLIMDHDNLYVLETYGKEWAYQKKDKETISNNCSIIKPDKASKNYHNFKKEVENKLYTHFSGSNKRRSVTQKLLTKKIVHKEDIMNVLRSHSNNQVLSKGSVDSVCMHYGKMIGDHTTSSMIIELTDAINIYITGSSLPCLSIYKKIPFKKINTKDYWLKREKQNRKFLNKKVPNAFYEEKKLLERKILDDEIPFKEAIKMEDHFYHKWINKLKKDKKHYLFLKRWKKKDRELEKC